MEFKYDSFQNLFSVSSPFSEMYCLQYIFTTYTHILYYVYTASYALAILLFTFSFIWPFLQLIVLILFCWMKIKVSIRTNIFRIIDITAKIPLLNVFYLIGLVNVLSQDISFTLLQADYTGATSVKLQYGLIIFTLASLLLMGLTIQLNYYHNQLLPRREYNSHTSSWNRCNQPLLFYPRIHCKKLIALTILIITCCCAIAMYSTSLFTVKFENGMADYMTHPIRTYTIIDVGSFNVYNLKNETQSGRVILSIVYTILVIILPILLLISLLVLWLIPLPKSFNPNDIRYYLWCLFCWNGLDIIFIICILLIFEFPSLYDYLLFDEYSTYCSEYLSYLDETCPSLSFETGPALWLSLATSIGLYIIVHYTVFGSYDDDLPTMQTATSDEHYLGISEAQPLNSNHRNGHNAAPSLNGVKSDDIQYFENGAGDTDGNNDDGTAEYFE